MSHPAETGFTDNGEGRCWHCGKTEAAHRTTELHTFMPVKDHRDIIIRTLTAEVEHLIEDAIPSLIAGYPLNAPERADARTHRAAARALLARLEARP